VSLVGNWTKTGKKEPQRAGERAPTPGERVPGECAPSPCECALGVRSPMLGERAHSGFP
jgi:hypothetical protein